MDDFAYKILNETAEENWWYRVRRKMVKNFIKRYSVGGDKRGLEILDIGCGTGALLKELEDFGVCYGLDNSWQAIDFCKKGLIGNVKIGDATNIPYKDNKFDIVLAMDILEHIKDDELSIKEIRRVLKDGGLAIIFVPAFNFLWGKSDELGRHYRRYRLKDLKLKIKNNGFYIIKASYFNFFLFAPIMFARFFIRILSIPIKSENEIGIKSINSILYFIFYTESILFNYINFPFGVSAMVICRK